MPNRNIDVKMGIHNKFEIEVIDAVTGTLKQKALAFNVICNTWWTRFFSETRNNEYGASEIAYGSGVGTPSVSDETLFHYEGLANSEAVNGASETYNASRITEGVVSRILKRVIRAGDAVGIDITEVGITDNSNRILTHAMLQDMNGNPISIHKTNTDVINIYGTVYIHFSNTYDISVLCPNEITSSSSCLLACALKASTWGYIQGTWGSDWSSLTTRAGKANLEISPDDTDNCEVGDNRQATRSLANKTYVIPALRYDTNYANMNGVGTIGIGYSSKDIEIRTGRTTYPSSRVTSESIGTGDGTTTKFKTKTDNPYNATVYVNGVAVNGVTIVKKPSVRLVTDNYYKAGLRAYFAQVYDGTEIPCRYETEYNYGLKAGTYINYASEVQISQVEINSDQDFLKVECSNDGTNWTPILQGIGQTVYNVPSSSKYRFIRFNRDIYKFTLDNNENDGYNVVFNTAPSAGDVITIDYTTDYIPKDSDHVLDVSVTLQFGDYQGE